MFRSLLTAPALALQPHLMLGRVRDGFSDCTVNGQAVDCGPIGAIITSMFGLFVAVMLAVSILMIVSNWKVYTKAGKPGWASIIPIYNYVVLLEIVGRPIWWVIFMFIPMVNIIMYAIVLHELSKVFGKDIGFTLGLIFLPFIFYPILAFGGSKYQGRGNPPSTPLYPQTPPTPPTVA